MKYNNAFETDFCFGTDFCLGFAWQNPRQAFASLRPQKPLKALLCTQKINCMELMNEVYLLLDR
jgi:hypothetical protein